MIPHLGMYSTESLIKELEKRGFDCEDIQMQVDEKRLGSEPFSFAGVPGELFDPEQLSEIETNRLNHISSIEYKIFVHGEMEKARDSFKKHK